MKSTVHRRVHMDYVGAKLYDDDGNLIGELRIVGLFASTAYTEPTSTIPFLRRKVASVLARAGYGSESHSGRALRNVLEAFRATNCSRSSATASSTFPSRSCSWTSARASACCPARTSSTAMSPSSSSCRATAIPPKCA